MDTKRQIRGTKYNVAELVKNAIATVETSTLKLDSARKSLAYLGNTNPTDELVNRYARETAILDNLARATGAYGFKNQIGKINFSTAETTIADVESYLSRRNSARGARWTASHRGY